MPWDYDLDVQVSNQTLGEMAGLYNGTVFEYVYAALDDEDEGEEEEGGEGEEEGLGLGLGGTGTGRGEVRLRMKTKRYMLDVNPYWAQRTRLDGLNIIDARWIDMENGMYVDITGLSEDRLETAQKGEMKKKGDGKGKGNTGGGTGGKAERKRGSMVGVWTDKNYHGYGTRQIWPLRKTEFEGVEAWVPWDVEGVLEEEYGGKSLTAEEWAG